MAAACRGCSSSMPGEDPSSEALVELGGEVPILGIPGPPAGAVGWGLAPACPPDPASAVPPLVCPAPGPLCPAPACSPAAPRAAAPGACSAADSVPDSAPRSGSCHQEEPPDEMLSRMPPCFPPCMTGSGCDTPLPTPPLPCAPAPAAAPLCACGPDKAPPAAVADGGAADGEGPT